MRLLLGNSFPGLTDCTRMAGTWPDEYAGRGISLVLLTRSALSTRESSSRCSFPRLRGSSVEPGPCDGGCRRSATLTSMASKGHGTVICLLESLLCFFFAAFSNITTCYTLTIDTILVNRNLATIPDIPPNATTSASHSSDCSHPPPPSTPPTWPPPPSQRHLSSTPA